MWFNALPDTDKLLQACSQNGKIVDFDSNLEHTEDCWIMILVILLLGDSADFRPTVKAAFKQQDFKPVARAFLVH